VSWGTAGFEDSRGGWFLGWLERLEGDVVAEMEPALLDAGEQLIVKALATFTSKRSGASVDCPIVEIYSFADGSIIEADVYDKTPGRDRRSPSAASAARIAGATCR
jgi:hypothetical protein